MEVDLPTAFEELFTPMRYKAFYGGRGSAKSHSIATALLIKGGESRKRILCAREVQNSIKDSVKQLLDDKIEAHGMGAFYKSLDQEIRGRNGTKFIFAGLGKLTTDQLKSMEGVDILWIEEAQTISGNSLEIITPTIRKPGSEIWASWNPRNAGDPIDQMFRGPTPPENAIIRRVNYDDNPFFTDVLEGERRHTEISKPGRYGHIWLGEYEPAVEGAIWDRKNLHEHRRTESPTLNRIVVAVDPAVTNTDKSNDHGIVAAGTGEDGRGYVLEDVSKGGTPKQWAKRAIALYDRLEADAIVVETNQGGDMVKNTLESVRKGIRIIEVRASRGKHVRAEPIASLYELGKVSHVGTFTELENQMCAMTVAGYEGDDDSPDRCDALVWALTELFPKLVPKSKNAGKTFKAKTSFRVLD